MDSYAYRRAVAEVLVRAADRRLIEPEVRIKPGKLARDVTDFGSALFLVDKLIENDSDRWWTLEPLQPELGRCVMFLRRMQRAEAMASHGEEILRELQDKTSPGRDGEGRQGPPGAASKSVAASRHQGGWSSLSFSHGGQLPRRGRLLTSGAAPASAGDLRDEPGVIPSPPACPSR